MGPDFSRDDPGLVPIANLHPREMATDQPLVLTQYAACFMRCKNLADNPSRIPLAHVSPC